MAQTRTGRLVVFAGDVPVIEVAPDDVAMLYEQFGVGDLADVPEANRTEVKLSERSSVVCPMHGRRLVPDGCRSCWFLAGGTRR